MITMRLFFGLSAICFFTLLISQPSNAQDPMKVAPNIYNKVLLENDNVRVMEVFFKPGDEAAKHSHPAHFAYILTGGKLSITTDGKTVVAEAKAGDVIWMEAETHSAKNTGDTDVKLIVVELKGK